MKPERLDKLLASQGGETPLSRRDAKALIARGRVTIDGVRAKSAEQKIDPGTVSVAIDGDLFKVTVRFPGVPGQPGPA